MSVQMSKGDVYDITRNNPDVNEILVGLGWDESPRSGFLGLKKGVPIDCDVCALMLVDDKLVSADDVVFYNNLEHSSGCLKHTGDNRTGKGPGDDERIYIKFSEIPSKFNKIVIAATIYKVRERGQDFGHIKNAFIRVADYNDEENEFCRLDLSEGYDGYSDVVFGELVRDKDDEWSFVAVAKGGNAGGIIELTNRYRKQK